MCGRKKKLYDQHRTKVQEDEKVDCGEFRKIMRIELWNFNLSRGSWGGGLRTDERAVRTVVGDRQKNKNTYLR